MKKVLIVSLSVLAGIVVIGGGITATCLLLNKGSSSETPTSEVISTSEIISETPSSEIVLKSFSITFVSNSEDVIIDSITQVEGTALELPSPTRVGYDFLGWYSDSQLKRLYNESTFPSKNVTLYAKWGIKEYTLSFDCYGNGVLDEKFVEYGSEIVYPEVKKEGYTFTGWMNEGTLFEETKMPASDVHLVASWSLNEYHYTYELDGGINDERNLTTYTIESQINSLYYPTKEGYSFMGWYTDEDYKDRVYIYPLSDATFYAKWDINQFDITLSSAHGNYTTTSVTYDYNQTVSLPTLKEDGYTFLGWYVDDTKYEEGFTVTESLSLIAKWDLITYSIGYELNEGTLNNPVTSYSVESKTTIRKPERTGYDFKGWYIDSELNTPFVKLTLGDITLYAKWEIVDYTLSFDTDGGNAIASKTVHYQDVVTLDDPEKTGYTFIGWYDENNQKVDSPITIGTSDITLKAQYSINSYTLFYNYEQVEEYSKEYNEVITLPTPKEDGYEFLGWYDALGNKQNDTITMPARDLILTPRFQIITYHINYMGDFDSNPNASTFTVENRTLEAPLKKGYKFLGWYYDIEYKEEVEELKLVNFIDVYAKFEIETYSITYHYSGNGISETLVETYDVNTNDIVLPTIDRGDNYFFFGWYLDSDHQNKITTIKKGSTGDVEVYAHEECYFDYEILRDGEYTITGLTSYAKEKFAGSTLTIPTTLEGHTIVCIDHLTGENNTIKKVIIPEGIVTLNGTFEGWDSLEEVEIPSTVTHILDNTFRNCQSLKEEMVLSSSVVNIGKDCFYNSSIETLDLSNCSNLITSMPDSPLGGMNNLKLLKVNAKFRWFTSDLFDSGSGYYNAETNRQEITVIYPGNGYDFKTEISLSNSKEYGDLDYDFSFGSSAWITFECSDGSKYYSDRSADIIVTYVEDDEVLRKVSFHFEGSEFFSGKYYYFDIESDITTGQYYKYSLREDHSTFKVKGLYNKADVSNNNFTLEVSGVGYGYIDYDIIYKGIENYPGFNPPSTVNYQTGDVFISQPTSGLPLGYVLVWYKDEALTNMLPIAIDGSQILAKETSIATVLYPKLECIYNVTAAQGNKDDYEISGLNNYYKMTSYYKTKYYSLHFEAFEYNGKTVNSISRIDYGLVNYDSITDVYFGEGIVNLGYNYAFSNFNNIKHVTVKNPNVTGYHLTFNTISDEPGIEVHYNGTSTEYLANMAYTIFGSTSIIQCFGSVATIYCTDNKTISYDGSSYEITTTV